MAAASITESFNCTSDEFYSIVSDYVNYPKFLSEVTKCRVMEEKGNCKLIEFQIFLIKNFTYRLWMKETAGKRLDWEFDSGDLFKASNGHWEIQPDGDGRCCKATYSVDVKFKIFVPGPVANTLVKANLPNMVASYHKRVKELYGK